MSRIASNEREMAKKHPVSFPIFVVLGLMVITILVLGYFLYQTVADNTRLKQKYQNNTSDSVGSYENSQDQQLDNSLEGE